MDYNRSVNAVVIGHILVAVLLAASAYIYINGYQHNISAGVGILTGYLAISSLCAAYLHEGSLMVTLLENVESDKYRTAYRIYRACAFASPIALVIGYLILLITLIAGV